MTALAATIQNSIILSFNHCTHSKSLLVAIGWAGVAFDFNSSHTTNQQKSLLVAIGPVFTSSHPEQRS